MSTAEKRFRLATVQTVFDGRPDRSTGLVGASSESLQAYYRSHPEAVPLNCENGLPAVVKALLRPSVEEALIQDFGRSYLKGGSSNARVFSPEDFLKIANLCLSREVPLGTHAVEMNMGVTIGKFNPTMLAYFMLSLNRYSEVVKVCREVGFAPGTIPVRLRIFSTVGARLQLEDGVDESELRAVALEQERWLMVLIRWLYPDVASSMPIFEVAKYPVMDMSKHQSDRRLLAKVLRGETDLQSVISRSGERHGGAFADFFSNDYLAWHLSGRTFRDGDPTEPSARISIGGPSEGVFNQVRILAIRDRRSRGEETPLVSAITAPSKVICKSPPYLNRDGLFREGDELSLERFLDGTSEMARKVLSDPGGLGHPTKSEWLLIGRTVAERLSLRGDREGINSFREFFRDRIS
ncbi:MAG: hypothetical protein ACI9QC_000352 [Oceanicoccus sp.]|jgi:hypothetical protein